MKTQEIHDRRLAAYRSIQSHPWLGRSWQKLSETDRQAVLSFIEAFKDLDIGPFELKINRLFLDQPEKPRRWKEISEILTCINTDAKA
jgi:hypothetical protein